jgi:signal transduction histidine kinase
MIPEIIPEIEKVRLKVLESYSILDTLPEADYDDITAIAAEICGTPISLVSLVDEKRQWFKSHHGVSLTETPKEISFCIHAINQPSSVFIVPDARSDNRFKNNPLVSGKPHLLFYAGVPLKSDDGLPLGTLCVIDYQPRDLTENQVRSLTALSNQLMNVLNLRRSKLQLENAFKELEEKNKALEKFAHVAAHDLRSPLINISTLTNLFMEDFGASLNTDGSSLIRMIGESSEKLRKLIDGLLDYSRSESVIKEKKTSIELQALLKGVTEMFAYEKNLSFQLNSELASVTVNITAIQQILINLFANAIRYNDKPETVIEISVTENERHYIFCVRDNGPGIQLEDSEKVFELFETLQTNDRSGLSGNGIGLATVKRIVEKCGGIVGLEAVPGFGACFKFTIEK